VALADSKFQDLLRNLWHSREGRRALEFLAQLSGLKPLETDILSHDFKTGSKLHVAESTVGTRS
jgi:hypothetical protein